MIDISMEVLAELKKISDGMTQDIKDRVKKAFEMRHNPDKRGDK